SELGQAMRHYSALRFAILTVFFALVGGLITISFDALSANQFMIVATRVGGLIGTLAFLVFEYRLEVYMSHFENRAAELEKALGYNIYTGRKQGGVRFISTPLAIRLLYFAVIIFWIVSFFY
ncbi:MAG: hypothetical protein RML33_11425, partial [Acidobacteriota bacterium]|nr:hypothetical protein [Acidobacteriota bacterium]